LRAREGWECSRGPSEYSGALLAGGRCRRVGVLSWNWLLV
jgi:hypothetical protein